MSEVDHPDAFDDYDEAIAYYLYEIARQIIEMRYTFNDLTYKRR